MSTELTVPHASPFDAIRRVRDDGTEFWSARDLMPLLIGRLAEKVGRPYWCTTLEKLITPEPTIRITSKGLADLYQKLGGGTQLELAESS